MRLRNSTVAHSESGLAPSYAVVHLERDEEASIVRAPTACAMTVHSAYSTTERTVPTVHFSRLP